MTASIQHPAMARPLRKPTATKLAEEAKSSRNPPIRASRYVTADRTADRGAEVEAQAQTATMTRESGIVIVPQRRQAPEHRGQDQDRPYDSEALTRLTPHQDPIPGHDHNRAPPLEGADTELPIPARARALHLLGVAKPVGSPHRHHSHLKHLHNPAHPSGHATAAG